MTAAAPVPAGSGKLLYQGDYRLVALATALENLTVTAYDVALRRVTDRALGPVPPAIAMFLQGARQQHADHAAVWNSALTRRGLPPVTDTPLAIAGQIVTEAGGTASIVDVMTLALRLEEMAAQTYTRAAGELSDRPTLATVAAVAPVECMHVAVLNFLTGHSPVPTDTVGVDQALGPDALTR
jgi:hypothetical protein